MAHNDGFVRESIGRKTSQKHGAARNTLKGRKPAADRVTQHQALDYVRFADAEIAGLCGNLFKADCLAYGASSTRLASPNVRQIRAWRATNCKKAPR